MECTGVFNAAEQLFTCRKRCDVNSGSRSISSWSWIGVIVPCPESAESAAICRGARGAHACTASGNSASSAIDRRYSSPQSMLVAGCGIGVRGNRNERRGQLPIRREQPTPHIASIMRVGRLPSYASQEVESCRIAPCVAPRLLRAENRRAETPAPSRRRPSWTPNLSPPTTDKPTATAGHSPRPRLRGDRSPPATGGVGAVSAAPWKAKAASKELDRVDLVLSEPGRWLRRRLPGACRSGTTPPRCVAGTNRCGA